MRQSVLTATHGTSRLSLPIQPAWLRSAPDLQQRMAEHQRLHDAFWMLLAQAHPSVQRSPGLQTPGPGEVSPGLVFESRRRLGWACWVYSSYSPERETNQRKTTASRPTSIGREEATLATSGRERKKVRKACHSGTQSIRTMNKVYSPSKMLGHT